jgi:RHS repeat-associated protein
MPDYYTSVAQDQAVYTFNPAGQELSHLVYEGNVSGGTLMRQINTVWGSTGSPQSSTIVLEDGNTAVETDTTFDAYGNLTTLVEHNWGTVSAAGPVLRTTNLSYIYSGSSGSTYLAANILNRVLTKTVLDQNSVVQYSESIGYDSSGSLNAPCITGALQHNDTNYSCSFTTRGLATSDTVYANAAAQSGGETKNSTYDSLGNLRTAQLDCCQQKQWNYSATTQYTFPDSVVRGSGTPSLTTSYTYNAYTGQVVTSTDENGRQTSYTHDAYGRPLTITRPDNTVISYSYNDASQISSVSVPISGSSARKQQTTADTLGRPITVTLMDAAGNTYATISTIYDNFNRVLSSTNPNSGGTQYYTKKQYDVLGRLTTLTTPDGAVASYAYSTNTVTVTDPAGKSRKTAVDGVGRVTTAFEPDPTNNNLLTQQTSYTYTVLDALAGVSQGVQTRTFTYDGIGRLTNSSTPEAGAVAYQYNNFDLATQRTDARGVVTNYYYDALNRVAGLAYTLPQGSNVSPMPTSCTTPGGQAANVCYFYDQGGTTANALGRLTEIMDPTGSQTPTYDILGRMTQINKVTSGTTYTTSYAYNLSNELTSITYPSGRVVEQSVDAIGRICEVAPQTAGCGTAASPYATAFAYNAASEVTGFNYGNGVTAAFTYSPDRLQLTGLSYTKGTQTLFGLNYWYKLDSTNCPTGQTSNNGQIQCITDLVDTGRNVSYTYDPTERLATALTKGSTSSPQWGLSWTYDRYGNRTAQTPTAGSAPMNSLSFANPGGAQTNHADNFSYDASGNMTNDGENMLVYDAENRVTSNSTDSWACSYDGNGLRVKKVVGSTTTVYIFSGTKVIAEYVNGAAPSSPSTEYVYAGGSKLAKIQSGAITYYHQDHLSNRLVTNSTGGVAEQLGTYPFGESSYNTTNEKWLFTTYERDAESGNDYAMARTYINRFGRFSSSDRMSGSVADPQSLNHYGYVENDPINAADPSGMMMINMAQYILGFAGADINCELDGTDASCSFVSMLVGTGAAGQLPAGMNSAGFLDGNAYFISYTSDGETSDFDVSYPQLTAAEAEILGLPSELNPADGNFGGRGYSPEALKAALRKILKNPKCAALLGGTNKANQAVDHFLGQINVDAPGYSGNTQAKADIDSGAAWAETPVPDTGNFQGGQWTGPNFSTYIGNTVAGFTLSQQLTVQMHELIHATSSGSVIARGLVDLSNPFGQLANVYQIHKDCGTALPPNY